MGKILVLGGAGYVGSATAAWLIDQGHDVWVLDDLSVGHRELVLNGSFVRAQVGDRQFVTGFLKQHRFDGILHFAARSIVPESVKFPEMYRKNNVEQARVLLEAMVEAGTRRIVFSSTCAIFGDPGDVEKMDESLPQRPLSPYGENKVEVERMLQEFAANHGISAIALRYFNAAGAEPKLRVGEWHEPETHLIPRVIRQAVKGEAVQIFGTDYPTKDGTCIRDYIHVTDLARAHEAALLRLLDDPSPRFEAYNLGSENGHSVRDVVVACERVLGRKIQVEAYPRRAGDSPRLVADSSVAKRVLGFRIEFGLDDIIRTAYEWEKRRRALYAHPAVFLDRDGTINDDPGYLSDPSQLKLFPDVGEALASLKRAGYLLVVVSNQSGVGRGLIEAETMPKINDRLDELLGEARIDRYELCFHRPEERCECRKPRPKLILDAAQAMKIDLSRSVMIGDKQSDIDAGWKAGCGRVALVRTGYGRETEERAGGTQPHFTGDSLLSVARWILNQENAGS